MLNRLYPTVWNAHKSIRPDQHTTCMYPYGQGAARLVSCPTLYERLCIAWGVFTGRMDAIEWALPGGGDDAKD